MESKHHFVKGGILITHKFKQGKHEYEVERIVQKGEHRRVGAFVRKGDQLLKINEMSLHDLSPECFAELLTKDSPMLTVHQPHTSGESKCRGQEGIRSDSKEPFYMTFSLEMISGKEMEDETDVGCGSSPVEEVQSERGQGGMSESLLVVSMRRTSFSVVKGRGCGSGCLCPKCGSTACHINEVVMVAESKMLTLVGRRISNFLQEKVSANIFIQSLMCDKYIQRRHKSQIMPSNSMTHSANMTIYYYKSDYVDGEFKGAPVVLNFTGSDTFLKCIHCADKPKLCIEACEKRRLKHISDTDKETWPLVFYMKASQSLTRRFESANCPGWFINVKSDRVDVERIIQEDDSFYFLIQK